MARYNYFCRASSRIEKEDAALRSIRQKFPSRIWLVLAIAATCMIQTLFLSKNTIICLDAVTSHNLQSHSGLVGERPVILQLTNDDLAGVTRLLTRLATLPDIPRHENEDTKKYYGVDNGSGSTKNRWHKNCVPLDDWQDELHPSCLDFHEIDITSAEVALASRGNYRDTWKIRDHNGQHRAMKMLKVFYKDKKFLEFSHQNAEDNRIDTMATAQLSASNYIPDIYGSCFNSAFFDFADRGHLYDLNRRETSKDELLTIAHDVAMAVADSQLVNSEGKMTLLHNDIKLEQFLYMDGKYRLNDFNLGILASWNTAENEYCTADGRSIETIRATDIYNMGKVLNYLLGGTWHSKHPKWFTPDLNSTHPFDVYVAKTANMCLSPDPKDRPTARQVAELLKKALSKLK